MKNKEKTLLSIHNIDETMFVMYYNHFENIRPKTDRKENSFIFVLNQLSNTLRS